MGAQRGMGLALHLGDTCFLSGSFPLAQETGISLSSWKRGSGVALINQWSGRTSGSPPELGTQWQCHHDLWKRPKQSDREGQANTVPRRWQ